MERNRVSLQQKQRNSNTYYDEVFSVQCEPKNQDFNNYNYKNNINIKKTCIFLFTIQATVFVDSSRAIITSSQVVRRKLFA